MPADAVTGAERAPRRARYLIPTDIPRRGEFLAACAVLIVVAHLIFAQLTILLALAFHGVTKVSRWRSTWLAVPAAVGLLWTLAIGPAAAIADFTRGPASVTAYLGGIGGHPGRLMHLGAGFSGLGHWLPQQLPIALIAGAAEAAVAAWLSWLHTDEQNLPTPRPGLVVAARRTASTRAVRAGGVVTKDGGCLGVTAVSGSRAALSWREAAGGVLITGAPGSGASTTSFQLVHAAIRRRKPVIAVDPSGDPDLAADLAGVCAAAGAPLYVFGTQAGACYEPFRSGDPATRAALVLGMIDWGGTPDHYRRSCTAYINDVFELIDAAPGDPRVPALDEVIHLLSPQALQARMDYVPAYHSRRKALTERVRVSVSLAAADHQVTSAVAGQLNELRASPLGRRLRRSGIEAGVQIDLGRVVRERAVALFSLGGADLSLGRAGRAQAPARAAAMIACLVGQDVLAAGAELRRIGVDGDGLVWFGECGWMPPELLAELIGSGAGTGLPVLLTTASVGVAGELAGRVGALVIHRMTEPAGFPAAGPALSAVAALSAEQAGRLDPGEFMLVVDGAQRRPVTLGKTVNARIPQLSAPRPRSAMLARLAPGTRATEEAT
jgi:hypothetical protein